MPVSGQPACIAPERGVGSDEKVGYTAAIHHRGDGIANLEHGESNRTCSRIGAVVARLVAAAGSALDRCDRAVEHADHLTDTDRFRVAGETVAASPTLCARGPSQPRAARAGWRPETSLRWSSRRRFPKTSLAPPRAAERDEARPSARISPSSLAKQRSQPRIIIHPGTIQKGARIGSARGLRRFVPQENALAVPSMARSRGRRWMTVSDRAWRRCRSARRRGPSGQAP